MSASKVVFDVGNSALKLSEVKDNELLRPQRVAIEEITNYSMFEDKFRKTFEKSDLIIASIGVSKFVDYFEKASDVFGNELKLVSGKNPYGAKIVYGTPQTLGADRIANTLAVNFLNLQPAVVVDCGTAINIDVIDQQGAFIGGMITAGIETTNKALQHFAPALPDIELAAPENILGVDTLSCIASGIIFGAVGMIETSVSKLKELYEVKNVILTGGHSEILHPLINVESTFDPWFTLKGLSSVENSE